MLKIKVFVRLRLIEFAFFIIMTVHVIQLKPCVQPGKTAPQQAVCQDNLSTALYVAVTWGLDNEIKTYIDAHVDSDMRIFNNWTMLHLAAQEGNRSIVRMLIQAHAAIDALDDYQYTPLHFAAEHGHKEVVQDLVQAGADSSAVNDDGKAAYQLAHASTTPVNQDISDYLTSIPRLASEIHAAVRRHDCAAVAALVEKGAPILTTARDGQTPVHNAIGAYDPTRPTELDNIARILIKTLGHLAANVRNRQGQTPLHIAALHGNVRLAGLLLSRGTNPNAQDNDGNTPLHLARDLAVTNQLLRHGADISAVNRAGETPISTQIGVWQPILLPHNNHKNLNKTVLLFNARLRRSR